MENAEVIDQNDRWSSDLNESDLSDARNEISSPLICGNGLQLPVLDSFYRVPNISKKSIEPIVLDTSLPYIPVYTHLKMYDLKPIQRPSTPPILSELRLKFHFRSDSESYQSSKASPSTGRTSKRKSSIALKPRESERSLKMEYQI